LLNGSRLLRNSGCGCCRARRRGNGRGSRRSCCGEAHTPETRSRFGEFQFDVAGDGSIIFRFNDLADDFLFRFVVGEENQLARGESGCQANDGAIVEDENGLRGFGKRLALVGAFDGAGTVDTNGNFESDRLRSRGISGSFVDGIAGGGRGDRGIIFFNNRRHGTLARKGLGATTLPREVDRQRRPAYLFMLGAGRKGDL